VRLFQHSKYGIARSYFRCAKETKVKVAALTETKSIVLVGVGGQGIHLASEILG
jgi:hypothetical protein